MASITVRDETTRDYDAVRQVHRLAFSEESPGQLVDDLRQSGNVVISLVAEQSEQIVGHALFSRIQSPVRALTLAPVGIRPDVQKRGVGSALIRKGLERARHEQWEAVFVLGDPAYYGRFGFNAASAQGYHSPYKGQDFMGLLLNETASKSGQLVFPSAFDEDIQEHRAREAARVARN